MGNFIPKKPEKETISVRISSELLLEVERKAAATGISRNEFITQCILYAMEHIQQEPDQCASVPPSA